MRPEREEDRPRILAVTEAAFGQKAEALLVERLWAAHVYRPGLSLVTEPRRDGVVGHAMVTTAWDSRRAFPSASRPTYPIGRPQEASQLRRLSAFDPSIKGHIILPDAFDDLPE